jgi:hypothetical protein
MAEDKGFRICGQYPILVQIKEDEAVSLMEVQFCLPWNPYDQREGHGDLVPRQECSW